MEEIQVRRAEACDLGSLLALHLALQDHLESASPDLWRMTPQARQQLEGQLAARLAAPESCVLVAEDKQWRLVGTASGRIVTNGRYLPARSGVIDQLYVLREHRRRGIGSLLVAELRRFFIGHEIRDVSLRSMYGNAQAEAFWEALGFTPRIVTLGTRLAGGP